MRLIYPLSLVLLAFALAGCSPSVPAETLQPATQPPPLAANELPPPTDTPPAEATSGPAAGWREYRDARYGYGISLPCYWLVTPTPPEGMFAALAARSYSDEFFSQHSERGLWTNDTWPLGAFKLDAVVLEGLDPALSVPDALRAWYSNPQIASEQELVSVEETSFGLQPAYLATVQGGLQGGARMRIVVFSAWRRSAGFVRLPTV